MHTRPLRSTTSRATRGFVLGYALGALLALSLVATLAARMANAHDSGARMTAVRDQLIDQASLIRTKLLTCAAMYPTSAYSVPFNAFPVEADAAVRDLVCPGAPADANHMWQADDALAAPVPPRGFSDWQYTRDASHIIRLQIMQIDNQTSSAAGAGNAAKRFGPNATFVAGVLSIRMN